MQKIVAKPMLYCPSCNEDAKEGDKFCRGCGHLVEAKEQSMQKIVAKPMLYCPSCNWTLKEGDKFCDSCGYPIVIASSIGNDVKGNSNEMQNEMFCKNCGNAVGRTTEFCISCGARPMAGNSFCFTCGVPHHPLAEICVKCGVRLSKTVGESISEKSRLATTLLAFFIGELGAHRFYIGDTVTGTIMLFLFIFGLATFWFLIGIPFLIAVSIWALVDFIYAVSGSMRDNQGKPIKCW